MNVDDRRFLRRHYPSFAEGRVLTRLAAEIEVFGEVIAVRSDGVVFYRPEESPEDVYVGWLARDENGLGLKASPASRKIASLEDFNAEMAVRAAEFDRLLGE